MQWPSSSAVKGIDSIPMTSNFTAIFSLCFLDPPQMRDKERCGFGIPEGGKKHNYTKLSFVSLLFPSLSISFSYFWVQNGRRGGALAASYMWGQKKDEEKFRFVEDDIDWCGDFFAYFSLISLALTGCSQRFRLVFVLGLRLDRHYIVCVISNPWTYKIWNQATLNYKIITFF